MAGEEVFVSSSILSVATIGVFAMFYYLSWQSKDELMQRVWVLLMMLGLTQGMMVQRVAFNVTGLYDLRDMTFILTEGIMWVMVGLIFFVVVSVFLNILKSIADVLHKTG